MGQDSVRARAGSIKLIFIYFLIDCPSFIGRFFAVWGRDVFLLGVMIYFELAIVCSLKKMLYLFTISFFCLFYIYLLWLGYRLFFGDTILCVFAADW